MTNGAQGHTARMGSSAVKDAADPFRGDANIAFSNGYISDEDVAGIESDDPTNTAMFLDENEEKELHGVTPGTPMAFKKLGQLTTKSITRQKDAQTPGRTTRVGLTGSGGQYSGAANVTTRYVNTGSPSKKGKQEESVDLMSSAIPRLTPKNNTRQGIRRQDSGGDMDVSKSIRRIRESRRAGEILGRIKMGSLESKIPRKTPLATMLAEKNNGFPGDAQAQNQALLRTSLDPEFDRNEFSELLLPNPRVLFPAKGKASDSGTAMPNRLPNTDERCKTPENKRQLVVNNGTPYNALRALSEKSDRSQRGSMRAGDSDTKEISSIPFPSMDPFANTPRQRKRPLEVVSTPKTENRQRIDDLRRFFNETKGIGIKPSEPPISVESVTPVRNKLHNGMLLGSSDGSSNILASPSPVRRSVSKANGANQISSSSIDGRSDSISSLLTSLVGERQQQDPNRPIPFVLNQGVNPQNQQQQQNPEQEQEQEGMSNDQNNFMDISMQLNSSIAALNCGLREQLERGEGTSRPGHDYIDTAASAMEDATARLNQSLGSLVPDASVAHNSAGKQTAPDSELGVQVETLRRTMDDTKNIVFAIQRELSKKEQQEQEQRQQNQAGSSESTKLDSILGLLGALDMRLHMLEGRQRLEQNASLTPQRSNIGSTKVYASNRQHGSVQGQGQNQNRQQDIISRIGQLAVYCLNRYPLMIIGALFIILLSELLVIGGFSLDMQSMRGLGQYALEEVKRHIPAPPQPPS